MIEIQSASGAFNENNHSKSASFEFLAVCLVSFWRRQMREMVIDCLPFYDEN